MKGTSAILLTAGLAVIIMTMAGFGGGNLKSSLGAPPGNTNSPGDGQNCTHCMGGSATPVSGWITSDIPASGYLPGNTYTITVTATGTGNKGFEVSPQDPSGNLIGILTAGTGNQLVGSNKYVTHTQASPANPKIWTFQWTAPSSGAGDVTFYGSIVVGKPNTHVTTMTVPQSTVGIREQGKPMVTVFPNPVCDKVFILCNINESCKVHIDLLTENGKTIRNLMNENIPAGTFLKELPILQQPGFYFMKIAAGKNVKLVKIVVQNK